MRQPHLYVLYRVCVCLCVCVLDWLRKRKKWRASELIWGINHSHKHLHRAGKANAAGFKWMTHDELTSLALFELEQNNRCHACGQVWCRDLCIPMGGSFSAQSAGLHSIGSTYTHRGLFRALGDLRLTPEGYPYWQGQYVTALCHFHDNIVLATDAPHEQCAQLINQVHGILEHAWGLRVVCECMPAHPTFWLGSTTGQGLAFV